MDLKNIPKSNISTLVGDSIDVLPVQIEQKQRFELRCLGCRILYYGNKKIKKCQYCFSVMKIYKFKDWQKEVMENFFEKYKGSCIWLRR